MDFATEEKLCRHAHEVWLEVAGEAGGGSTGAELKRAEASCAGREVLAALRLQDAFTPDFTDFFVR